MTAFVQQATNQGINTGSLVVTLPANATAGNLATLSVFFSNVRTVSSVSGLGATWTRMAQVNDGSNFNEIWKGTGIAGGSAAVTITFSGGSLYPGANLAEFSGSADLTTGSASSSASATSSVTPSKSVGSGGLAVGFVVAPDGRTVTNTDSPSAWTSLTSVDVSAAGRVLLPCYRIATGAESPTRQVDISGAAGVMAVGVAATAPATIRPSKTLVTVTALRSRAASRSLVI